MRNALYLKASAELKAKLFDRDIEMKAEFGILSPIIISVSCKFKENLCYKHALFNY